ncbi:hypothetical protein GGR22_002899 [Flavobacterium gossypii]|uniref:HNH endonuclease n=1 Tax=Flavobacterium gossypii TaxID=1646119 RepID=A0ABR6DSR4_9FLAO|nr:hypothetical protein [Flavobacterium gossypii]MBA9074726.1 hypothetical protein [Flavobacterium gossypii]
MIKIKYPSQDNDNMKIFHDEFSKAIKDNLRNEASIDAHLKEIPYKGEILTLNNLLTFSLVELIATEPLLKSYATALSETKRIEFIKLFDYENLQPAIADFFMRMNNLGLIDMCSCYYCNIDYINVFNDIGQYKDKLHFLNVAQYEELNLIPGISKATINKIIAERPLTNSDPGFLTKKKRELIRKYSLSMANRYKNHFTLDHFLPKGNYPYFALSLYNLVPSCYACNSKFKGIKEFELNASTILLSPTSPDFVLEDNPLFSLYFSDGKDENTTKELTDITITFDALGIGEKRFLEIFAIQGRYAFHKKEALNMVLKRQKYSDSTIAEIARAIRSTDEMSIKRDIFGSSIFNASENNQPLTKFKKDIAKKIGII